jgi:hypothetical protein
MVWKSNFLINGKPFTYDAFMLNREYFGSWDPFFPNAYFKDPKDAFKTIMFLDSKRPARGHCFRKLPMPAMRPVLQKPLFSRYLR